MIDTAAGIWETVALRLHFKGHDITRIKRDCHYQTSLACQTVLSEWLEGKGRQPTSWGTLIKALREAGLPVVAGDLEHILGINDYRSWSKMNITFCLLVQYSFHFILNRICMCAVRYIHWKPH